MAIRTSSASVQGVLLGDWDTVSSLTPFIASASVIVDRVILCAAYKEITLSETEAELVERWLAAHMYQQSDKGYTSKSTGKASGSFQGQTTTGFMSTLYGQTAMNIDPSGCLMNIDKGQKITFAWLGKAPSERIPYNQRD